MIYIDMMQGRLGNQMFQYAFARRMQIERKQNEIIAMNFHKVYKKEEKDGWENSLEYFNIQPIEIFDSKKMFITSTPSIFKNFLGLTYRLLSKLFSVVNKKGDFQCKVQPLLNKFGLYWLEQGYSLTLNTNSKNIYIHGYFESKKYFDCIRTQLLQEFTPKSECLHENQIIININQDIYEKILSSNSVCISIRRGDYVSDSKLKKKYFICNEDYYYKAVDLIKRKVEKPVLFIFSDDPIWAKYNLDFGIESHYEKEGNPLWEKVRLMTACKHFIISNSTFSWWVQYLGNFHEKIVVAPSKWNLDGTGSLLIDSSFELIEV